MAKKTVVSKYLAETGSVAAEQRSEVAKKAAAARWKNAGNMAKP